jgi:hypothetical protein
MNRKLQSCLLGLLLTVASNVNAQGLSEGFESGLPSSPPTTATNYTLSSGSWNILKGSSSTVFHSGAFALQLASGTQNTPSFATAPSVAAVTTVNFWTKGSSKTKVKVQKSENGGSFVDVSTLNITTGYSSFTVTVNSTATDVRIRFANTGSATVYVDDVTINASAPQPPPPTGTSPYFVSPTGDDANAGTLASPFKTIQKAVSVAVAGDTVYLRGGRHFYSTTISISKSGTAASNLYLYAYNGEKPILDFSAMAVSSSNRGLSLSGAYWHFKGIDFYKAGDNGMNMSGSNNIIELCNFYENSDTGLQIGGGAANNQVINCDSYFNEDPAQGNADGFAPKLDVGTGNLFRGCRAWQNSDDGWDGLLNSGLGQNPSTKYENCWCFMNGYTKSGALSSGNGNGFKMGGNLERHDATLNNCLSAFNKAKGFDQNNNAGSMILYNCTGYKNGGPAGKGNFGMNNNDPASGEVMIVKNCISYMGGAADVFRAVAQLSNNSWQDGHVVNDADFLSVDSLGLRGPRKADGSLPDINFMHLAAGSDLIDAGVNVGLPYNGTAPDLGCFETGAAITAVRNLISETAENNSVLQAWPNYISSHSVIHFTPFVTGAVRIDVINVNGQMIKTIYKGQGRKGEAYVVNLGREGLTAGTYLVEMVCGNAVKTTKIFVQ